MANVSVGLVSLITITNTEAGYKKHTEGSARWVVKHALPSKRDERDDLIYKKEITKYIWYIGEATEQQLWCFFPE